MQVKSATPISEVEKRELAKKILDLSRRVSVFSPPMKPFVRFSKYGKAYSRSFWDFDDLLQKKLLGMIYELVSPDTLAQLCIEQWKSNLTDLYRTRKNALEQAIHNNAEYPFRSDHRVDFIMERMRPGERILYIGCGAGMECFFLAKKGLRVVGIDTMDSLLYVAGGWATHLKLPTYFTCMDVMNLGFKPGSFDGFLLEFYSSMPSPSQTLALQSALATVLHPRGQGFIVATRKKYGSYWFRMGSRYSQTMTNWLVPHARADFFFSETDNCEERLSYGLYNKAHTVQSLSAELSHTFQVMECLYEIDPRYIIAVVKPTREIESASAMQQSREVLPQEITPARLLEIRNTLRSIGILCDRLEVHARQAAVFFEGSADHLETSRLEDVPTDVSGFIVLLRDILTSES